MISITDRKAVVSPVFQNILLIQLGNDVYVADYKERYSDTHMLFRSVTNHKGFYHYLDNLLVDIMEALKNKNRGISDFDLGKESLDVGSIKFRKLIPCLQKPQEQEEIMYSSMECTN